VTESNFLSTSPGRRWVCPKCGDVKQRQLGQLLIDAVHVYEGPYAGQYCIVCYAKWLSETIPKLRECTDQEKGEA